MADDPNTGLGNGGWRANAKVARITEVKRFGKFSGHSEGAVQPDVTGESYKNKMLLFKLSDLQMFTSLPLMMLTRGLLLRLNLNLSPDAQIKAGRSNESAAGA